MKKLQNFLLLFLASCVLANIGRATPLEKQSQGTINEEAPVLKTAQGKLIRALFEESEKVHLAVFKVGDEKSFSAYKGRLREIEAEIKSILLQLEKTTPLSSTEQAELRKLLKKEESRIGKTGDRASQHIVGLKNVLLSQKTQQELDDFMQRIGPLLDKQSARHYKPAKKAE